MSAFFFCCRQGRSSSAGRASLSPRSLVGALNRHPPLCFFFSSSPSVLCGRSPVCCAIFFFCFCAYSGGPHHSRAATYPYALGLLVSNLINTARLPQPFFCFFSRGLLIPHHRDALVVAGGSRFLKYAGVQHHEPCRCTTRSVETQRDIPVTSRRS